MISSCPAESLSVPGRARAGFTLVELLVSITVAALLLGILVSVMVRSLQVSQTSADTMGAYSSAATTVDLVATDLASLAVTRQPYEYLEALPETPTLSSIPAPNVPPMQLMMLITSPEDSAQSAAAGGSTYPDSGQVRAVSYRIAWQNPVSSTAGSNASNSVFGIYRQVATSADTFNSVLGKANQTAVMDLNQVLYGGNVANMTIPPVLSTFLTGNVVDFQVAFYANPISTGGGGNPVAGSLIQPAVIINPASASAALPYQKTELLGTQTLVNGTAPTLNGLSYGPAVYAEVSLTVIEEPGAKLWGDGAGTGARSPAAIKQRYGHTLTRKVALRTPE